MNRDFMYTFARVGGEKKKERRKEKKKKKKEGHGMSRID